MLTTQYLAQAVSDILAAPPVDPTTPPPSSDGGGIINTNGILKFFLQYLAPIALAVVGTTAMFRANKGEFSRVMISVLIAVIGLAVLAGAGTLLMVGDNIADTIVAK